MSGSPVIRPATPEDIPAVRRLLVETWHATYDGIFGREKVDEITSRWHAESVLAAGLDKPRSVFLVAEINGVLAGTASAGLDCGGTIDLQRLYVLPGFQGKGIGGALFAAITARFPDNPGVTLEVEPNNAPAIAFYTRLGFREVTRGTACGGDAAAGIAHLVMRRDAA